MKLVSYVPVFELEDTILKPFLHSVLDYLEEVITTLEERQTDDNVSTFKSIRIIFEL